MHVDQHEDDMIAEREYHELRFKSSTPIKSTLSGDNSNISASQQLNSTAAVARITRADYDELQRRASELALENEELKYEVEQLKLDNQRLARIVEEKDAIQVKMSSQIEYVTKTAYALYEKFRSFKCRYYEEQQRNSAWFSCDAGAKYNNMSSMPDRHQMMN